ncbi:MAG: NAD(P)-dependent oxidoreductase [Vicinamibacterales bacterium]
MSKRATAGILGASGFIGSRLAEWLILNDLADVRPIVRSFRGLSRLSRFDLDSRVADATDQAGLTTELQGCDVVFHCVVGGHETILKSIEATYRAAAAAGVRRLVYLSSAVVHGHNPAPGTDDDSELLANQPFEYNVSKVMAEQRLTELSQDRKVETVVLRPCIVFGPRSQWWTAQVATQLLLKTAYLVEGGTGICNTIYIDNLVKAMWLASAEPAAAGQAFLLTDGERVTWRDLYASVAAAVNVDPAGILSVSLEEMREVQRVALVQKRLGKIKQSRVSRLAIGMMSEKLKHVGRAVLSTPPPPPGTAAPVSAPSPVIDPEITSLQWCESMLPIAKAATVLGYQPQVSFKDASARTAAWLRFALGVS